MGFPGPERGIAARIVFLLQGWGDACVARGSRGLGGKPASREHADRNIDVYRLCGVNKSLALLLNCPQLGGTARRGTLLPNALLRAQALCGPASYVGIFPSLYCS